MPELARILDQYARAWDGDAWHGTPLRDVLHRVDAPTAARRLSPHSHTIWELAHHLEVWLQIPRRRILGEAIDPATSAEDWPPVAERSDAAWQATLARLDAAWRALTATIETLTDADLARPVPGKDYTMYVLLHGTLQHAIWHSGQIALLFRAAQDTP